MSGKRLAEQVTAEVTPGGAFRDPSSPGDVQTVALVGAVGDRLHLHCGDGRWHSPYCYVPGAPQGDPRWFMEYYGDAAAAVFGFELVGDRDLYVPDRDRIHAAIDRLNGELAEPIAIRFGDPGPTGASSARDYLDDFGHRARLPLPAVERGIHDYSYHLLAIHLPAAIVEHAMRRARRLLDGGDEAAIEARTSAIDYATGNLAFHDIWTALAKRTGAFHYYQQATLSTPFRLFNDLTDRGATELQLSADEFHVALQRRRRDIANAARRLTGTLR